MGLLRRIEKTLLDPKFYFTIAIFAGEASPSFFRINSGWMYIFGFIGFFLLIIKRKTHIRREINLVLVIYAIVLIRNISTTQDIIVNYELPNLGTAFILLLFSCLFYTNDDIDKIEKYIFWFMSTLALLGVIQFAMQPTERLYVFGGPNGYYKITLLFEVMCFRRFCEYKKGLFFAGSILGLLLCIATGSKGGIVSMVIIVGLELTFYLFNTYEKNKKLINRFFKIGLIVTVGLMALYRIVKKIPSLSNMLSRATAFLFTKDVLSFTSISARFYLLELGIDFFKESPIIGKGARYTYYYTNGAQPYSHNIFVEFLSEQGLVGTIPLVIFTLYVIYKFFKVGYKDLYLFCIFLSIFVYFSGSMFSGNILDAKPIFFFGILMFNYLKNMRQIKNETVV